MHDVVIHQKQKIKKIPILRGLPFQWGEPGTWKYMQSICEGDKSYVKIIKQGS